LLWQPVVDQALLRDDAGMRTWAKSLEERLAADNGTSAQFDISYQPGSEGVEATVLVLRKRHGVTTTKTIHESFFKSPEYLRIATVGTKFRDLVGAGAFVARGDDRQEVASVPVAIDWLMAKARHGQTIQRYKGLGEMNPDQLWETTINPETRRLMQVRIEDAITADEVFTTLMGDHVEPRREFIERNALSVSNLDI
jgi:DNA gyrase subunit B